MSRIFLSHSRELTKSKPLSLSKSWGDDDVFLDVDPLRGLDGGGRLQEARRKAANCCEAVVFIVSPN